MSLSFGVTGGSLGGEDFYALFDANYLRFAPFCQG